jgi:type I restriction enzyme S subunit
MKSDWVDTELGAVADLLPGYAFKSSSFTDSSSGIRLVRGDNVAQGGLRWDGAKRWPVDKLDGLEKYELSQGDVVIAMDRPWIDAGLKYASVTKSDVPSLLVQRVARLRARLGLDQGFLRYVVGSPQFTSYILGIQTGTAVPHISGSQIAAYRFRLPDIAEQRRIAGVLGVLDEKIEHNVEFAERCDTTTAVVFRHWFSRIEGGSPLRDHVKVVRGRSYKSKELTRSTVALVTLKSIRRGGGYAPEGLKPYIGDFSPDQVIEPGELVVAHTDLTQSADVIGKPALVPASGKFDRLVASLDLAVVRPTSNRVSRLFLYHVFLSEPFRRHTYGYANGSTVLHLNKDAVPSFEVELPPKDQLAEFEKLARPLTNRALAGRQETVHLAAIRDALLPKLVSGQLLVPDSYDREDTLGTLTEESVAGA